MHDCVPCITGHYCPQGTTNPLKCPRGTFNDVLGAKVSNLLCFCGLSQKPCGFQRSPLPQIILRCNILWCSKANAMKQNLEHSCYCPFRHLLNFLVLDKTSYLYSIGVESASPITFFVKMGSNSAFSMQPIVLKRFQLSPSVHFNGVFYAGPKIDWVAYQALPCC